MLNSSLTLFNVLLITISSLLLIPFLTLFVECVAAILPLFHPRAYANAAAPKIKILVPAHNEAAVIQSTLESLMPQIAAPDELVVIADNCTDETAAIARSCGVQVIERFEPDPTRRGKGYALDFGLRYISSQPPDVVVTVDSDCIVAPKAIERIAGKAHALGQPVQATYLMCPPPNPRLKDSISALAIVVKNLARPLGLSRLGLPNLLTGSGMAFPWSVISQVSLAGSKTCDDMQSCIDLAIIGYPATYCCEARVMGRLMENQDALQQRSRWEHGHLEMLTTEMPRLVAEAWKQRRFDLLALALEVAVPPLSLLVMSWFAIVAIALVNQFAGGSRLPVVLLAVEGGLLAVAILGAWLKFERFGLSLGQLVKAPAYALWKIPLYIGYWLKPQTQWLRTERD